MEILYLMIPVAALIALLIAVGFFWAVKSGQFDDLEGPAHSILMDEDELDVARRERQEEEEKHGAEHESEAASAEREEKP